MVVGLSSGAKGATPKGRSPIMTAGSDMMSMQQTLDLRTPSHSSDKAPLRPKTSDGLECSVGSNVAARRFETPRSIEGVQPLVVSQGVATPKSAPRPIGGTKQAAPALDNSAASDEGAFASALQQAKEEGLNIFAAAPTPTMRQTGRATGMLRSQKDWSRLNEHLPPDHFERQDWNHSTCAKNLLRQNDDERSNETVARELRVVSDVIHKEVADGTMAPATLPDGSPCRPSTRGSFFQPTTPGRGSVFQPTTPRTHGSVVGGPQSIAGRPSLPTPGAAPRGSVTPGSGTRASVLNGLKSMSGQPRNRFFSE